VSLTGKHGFQWWAKQQSVIRSWAELQPSGSETGLWALRKPVEEFMDMGLFLETTRLLCLMAEGYAKFGRADEGLAVSENARHLIKNMKACQPGKQKSCIVPMALTFDPCVPVFAF